MVPIFTLRRVATIVWNTHKFWTPPPPKKKKKKKNRALLKFMSIVFPDGYVLDTINPYFADGKNNDGDTTQHSVRLNSDLTAWLQESDVCVVDKGLRDVIDAFGDLGIETRMLLFIKQGTAEHSVEEANHSRIVTKVPWTVVA